MPDPLTRDQKKRLIANFKQAHAKRLLMLSQHHRKQALQVERNVLRKLNSVSVTLWNVKIKDVLAVERQKTPDVKRLIADINSVRQGKAVSQQK
ncbi:hypothetical protein DICA3_A03070 [Diutina catenulata]